MAEEKRDDNKYILYKVYKVMAEIVIGGGGQLPLCKAGKDLFDETEFGWSHAKTQEEEKEGAEDQKWQWVASAHQIRGEQEKRLNRKPDNHARSLNFFLSAIWFQQRIEQESNFLKFSGDYVENGLQGGKGGCQETC